MSSIEEEGRRIAERLGKDVDYKGPWLPYGPKGEFFGHFFLDKVTGSSFVNKTLEDAKASLIKMRKEFGAKPPVFKNNPIPKEEAPLIKGILPLVGIGAAVILTYAVLVRTFAFERRVYAQDGQYLVSVRYPGQRHDLREFVQPDNPDVVAVYFQYGPDTWSLYDWVCQNISYRHDIGEFFQWPSETITRRQGDCEDSSILLTSFIRASGIPNAYVALGSLGDYGHSWCQLDGQILETTFTSARVVPNPAQYCPYVLFDNEQVIELWPGALDEVFRLRRDESQKLNLIAEAVAC